MSVPGKEIMKTLDLETEVDIEESSLQRSNKALLRKCRSTVASISELWVPFRDLYFKVTSGSGDMATMIQAGASGRDPICADCRLHSCWIRRPGLSKPSCQFIAINS